MARTTSVTLGEYYEQFIEKQISEGRYQTVSEVIRDALRSMDTQRQREEKRDALIAELEKGRKSPAVENFDMATLIDELERRYDAN